ncbi:hypothetical protein ACFV6F_11855 [Kitasatospora phosalacinea]|uniref:hypothetical protein n=1 Tax=Kitasatospora phosalacinea TaxID=2065 RepID=UPI00364EFA4B
MAVKVVLTRDSVCMGDDVHAPHQQDVTFHGATLGEFVARVADYPLRMRGARWVMFLGWNRAESSPIAEISAEWDKPRLMAGTDPLTPLESLAPADGDLSFFFQYHAGSVPLAGPSDPSPRSYDPPGPSGPPSGGLDPLAGRLALWLAERGWDVPAGPGGVTKRSG